MAIVTVTRWRGNIEQAAPIARQTAAVLKRHGAASFRFGPCYAGGDAGKIYVAITYPDWATFGRAQQALAADVEYQSLFSEALKIGEMLDRSIIVAEEL
jgi:hypothetical protein